MTRHRFRVAWTEAARADLLSILDYIAARNPGAAAAMLDRLEKRAASLATVPLRGCVVPELARLQVREYRELVVSPYRRLYRVADSRVFVLALLDSRRNLEDALLERLIRER